MRRDELINRISGKSKVKKEEVESIMDAFQDIVKDTLLTGEAIIIDKFGAFEPRIISERIGVHPINGNRVVISPKREVVFMAAIDLKRELNQDDFQK